MNQSNNTINNILISIKENPIIILFMITGILLFFGGYIYGKSKCEECITQIICEKQISLIQKLEEENKNLSKKVLKTKVESFKEGFGAGSKSSDEKLKKYIKRCKDILG